MKFKIFSSFLLTLILMLSVISAATFSFTVSTPTVLTKKNIQSTFTLTNRGPETVNFEVTIPSVIADGKGHEITITSQSPLTLINIAPNQNANITLTYSGDTTNFKIGEFSNTITIKATDVGNSTNTLIQTASLKFQNTFCKLGENGSSITLSDVNIDNSDGDDTEWTPLDEITIRVKVENLISEKVKDINVELGLFNSDGVNVIKKMDNLDKRKIDLGSISEDKEETAEFNFKIPTDFEEGDYLLVVKSYRSGKEEELCTSFSSDFENRFYEVISAERETEEEKQVVVDNVVISPETAQCGEKVQVSGKVVNIGDEDYQDQIKVVLYNKELKLNLEEVIREDLDQGDTLNFDFDFDIPQNATPRNYVLDFNVYYDYDDSDNTYGITSERFTKPIKVEGNCQTQITPKLQISAELDSETPEAVAGRQLIVKATLRNTGEASSTHSLSVSGNSAWSSLVSIDPLSVTLNKGETKEVSIVFNIDKEAEGDKEFVIKALSGDKTIEQKVALTIAKTSATTDLSSKISGHLKRNWFIYAIIIVNLILLIAIISVIRGMVSSPKGEF